MKISRSYDDNRLDNDNIKSLLIIGTSEYGITNEVMHIKNEEELINYYGMNGSIYDSFVSIKDNDLDRCRIYILKPYGTHSLATFNLNSNGFVHNDCIIFKSIFSNELYNGVKIFVSKLGVTFEFPSSLNLNNVTYYYDEFNTVYSFIDKINSDTRRGINVVVANVTCEEFSSFDESFYYINENKNLAGGSSELDLDYEDKYERLEASYEIIKGIELDYICLTDIFLNEDTYVSAMFYKQLLLLCIEQLQFGILSLGIMTYYSETINDDKKFIDSLSNLKLITNVDQELEYLKFLMVVVYDKLFYGYDKKMINPSSYIAHLLCNVTTIDNITNKPFGKFITLNHSLEEDMIKELNSNGVLNFRYSVYNRSVVISNGITNYTIDNNYKYLTSICMIQNILPDIKYILESNLGEDITVLENKRIIDTKISELLTNKAKLNVIDKYNYEIEYDLKNGSITYTIELKNMYMAESISYIGNIKSV